MAYGYGDGGGGPTRQMLEVQRRLHRPLPEIPTICLLYTSDAADEEDSVELGGRRIIKKKKNYDVCLL